MFGNGKTKTGPTGLQRARRFSAIKPFEDALLFVVENAYSGVGDTDLHHIAVCLRADGHLPSGRRILNGIIQQVLEYLSQMLSVGSNTGKIGGTLIVERQALGCRFDSRRFHTGIHEIGDS